MELSIKTEHFTSKFLHININSKNQYNSFYPINYRTPTVTLSNLLLETPWMDAPFGICNYSSTENKFYIDLSFNGYNYDTEIKNFYRVIDSIDNFVINFIDNIDDKKENSYNRQIKYNKNNPPIMKLKIYKNTQIFDIYNNEITHLDVKPKSKVQALICCNGLWFFENKWGLSWKVYKIYVKKPEDNLELYPFLDSNIKQNMNTKNSSSFEETETETESDSSEETTEKITKENLEE